MVIIMIANCQTYAQEPTDALRYSWTTTNGTARNQAIGGAGASLGGEFSTLFINPAGLGFYKTDEFVITPYFHFQDNKSLYKNLKSSSASNAINIGASGFIFSFPNYNNTHVKNFTLGLGINKIADFSNNLYYKGINIKSSYSEKYLEELINNNVTDPNKAATDFPFGASLALNTYLIDTIRAADGSVSGYKSLAPVSTGLIQEQKLITSGGITDLAIGGAINLIDKLFIGGTINVPIVNYKRNATFKETDATTNTHNNFNYFEVNEDLQTTGYGLSGKFGIIYKPIEYLRLGLSIHSPVLYELTDIYSSNIATDLEGYGGIGIKHQQSGDLTNNLPGQIKYSISTPWHVLGSASYVFREVANVMKQRAFLTADIEYVDYSSASFKPFDGNDQRTKTYFNKVNGVVKQQYGGSFSFRLGGELKFNKIMYRLGGAYYSNPYKKESADHFKVSGGLGYRDKGIFIDLTYVYSQFNDVNYPYRLQDKASEAAIVRKTGGNILATIGFKF